MSFGTAFVRGCMLGVMLFAATVQITWSQTTAAADALSGPGVNGVAQPAGGLKTFEAWAYSDDGVVPVTKNVTTISSTATATTSAVAGALVDNTKTILISRGLFGLGRGAAYVGCYGVGSALAPANPKTPLHAFVISATPAGGSRADGNFLPPSFISPLNRVRASAATTGAGSCAGEATDPVEVLDGDYAFSPEVWLMTLEPTASHPAAIDVFGADSRSSAPLYHLSVAAVAPLTSPSQLDIQFIYDGSRLTLGGTPAMIVNAVRAGFVVTNGVATFGTDAAPPSAPLFNSTYHVSGGSVIVSEGVSAGAGAAECSTIDFQTEDDLVTPLGNGQSLTTPPEFGVLLNISSAGSNLGVTTFDSTPGGPNSGTTDPDMLVDKGNILMLQDSAHPTQSVPGFFDTPVDEPSGGDFIFDFTTPCQPSSVSLIDIDPPPNQGASVILTDENGATTTYSIPAGWTGTFHGIPGWRTLDLMTLANQVGNAPGYKIATASQTLGYDPSRVVRMNVHLTGLGAMDDLHVCFPGTALASATLRNGSGMNPTILRSDTLPVVGTTWRATLDCSGLGNGAAVLEGRQLATSGTISPFGELLVKGALLHRTSRAYSAAPSTFTLPIPYDLSLLGLEVHVQGFCSGPTVTGHKLAAVRRLATNAIDLTIGF